MQLSIIIPTYQEEGQIGPLVRYLRTQCPDAAATEILVADGGSTDQTKAQAAAAGATVLTCPRKGRAAQLNYGACQANGELLYFLHADSIPPAGFRQLLLDAVAKGAQSGCFRLAFDWTHPLLQFSAWLTRLPWNCLRFGDQSLFATRTAFAQAGGYREDLIIMEDQEIISRLQQQGPFRVLPRALTTSARKYRENGAVRLQAIFTLLYLLYQLGADQHRLVRLYRSLIRQDKV